MVGSTTRTTDLPSRARGARARGARETIHQPSNSYLPSNILTVYLAARKSIHGARGAAARVSVNFRKFSPCIARAGRARAGLTVYPPSWTLEVLAFDE